MAETDVKCVKLKSDQILWDSPLSVSEDEKVIDLSRGETRNFPCLVADKTWGSWRRCRLLCFLSRDVTGLSRTCRGHHGEVGVMEFGLYQSYSVELFHDI